MLQILYLIKAFQKVLELCLMETVVANRSSENSHTKNEGGK